MKNSVSSISWGAAFLMATSAIGPGFLTQTTVFTAQLGASFAFVILISVLLDLGAQLNIWRIVTVSGSTAPDLADRMLPNLGKILTAMIVLGGLAFNIGNIAGAGLGLEVICGMPNRWGAAISTALAIGLFFSHDTGRAIDLFAKILGLGMIALTAGVALQAAPPLRPVAEQLFFPQKLDWNAILTLVGGTVGGYIPFAGAHRLLAAGVTGEANSAAVTRSALAGIGVATAMRLLLFLAAWGVVAAGGVLDAANPPASLFRLAAGEWGYRFFGWVMWSAAITSIVGATYTSWSFLEGSFPAVKNFGKSGIAVFMLFSLAVFLFFGKPVQTLVFVGALNGLILPVALAAMLLAAGRLGVVLPVFWRFAGWLVVVFMGWMAVGFAF